MIFPIYAPCIPDKPEGASDNGRMECEPYEIEVTPEMIEAGVDALSARLGGLEDASWDYPSLARSVFLAMAAEGLSSHPSPQQSCGA